MKKIYFVILAFVVINVGTAQSWQRLNPIPKGNSLFDIEFDANNNALPVPGNKATTDTATTFVLSNEEGKLIDRLLAAGYGNMDLYMTLVALQGSSGGVISNTFLDVLAACPAGSPIFTQELNNYAGISDGIAINTDGTVFTTSIKGRSYHGQPGYSTYPPNQSGTGREIFTYANSPEYYINAGYSVINGDTTHYYAFAICWAKVQPTITVTSPNGYEMWERGTKQNITWTSQDFTGNVKIVLLRPPSYTVDIADNLGNSGFFEWTIPADQQVANNYKIRVQGVIPDDPMDESNNFFSIVAELPVPKIVINEIMYNPPEAGNDTLEYIELYNADDIAHNLQGWKFSKGVDFIFPSVTINPGEYLVTAIKASAMMNTFGVTALQWSSGALSNSGEQIELLDNLGNVVDNVTYGTNSPWPAAANNHGPSLSLIDPLLDNSLAINWAPETALAGVNSAGKPIYGTPGSLNFPGTAQGIFIPKGWGGISSYITPAQPSMEDVMQLIVNNLTIVQNFNYLYFPLYQINSIGNWDNNVGYQLKIENARYHVLSGTNVSSKTVNLTGGWNGLPVLSQCEVNANLLFDSLPGVIFVKDMGSNEVYWPGGGLNTLEKLIPGRAYYIKVAGPISITFPECE